MNHLPLIVDELQLARDGRGKLNFDVYALAEGVGRTRGNKSGGVDQTPTWQNCILTSGETPITGASSGAGAVNRVIEIECRTAHRIIEDGHATAGCFARITVLREGSSWKSSIRRTMPSWRQSCTRSISGRFPKTTPRKKQAMAAAVILTADGAGNRLALSRRERRHGAGNLRIPGQQGGGIQRAAGDTSISAIGRPRTPTGCARTTSRATCTASSAGRRCASSAKFSIKWRRKPASPRRRCCPSEGGKPSSRPGAGP